MDLEHLQEHHEADLDLVHTRLHGVETRLAVLETKSDNWEMRLADLHSRIASVADQVRELNIELRKSMDYVGHLLREHIDQERQDREKMLRSALMATLGGVASVAGWALLLFWEHLIPGFPGIGN